MQGEITGKTESVYMNFFLRQSATRLILLHLGFLLGLLGIALIAVLWVESHMLTDSVRAAMSNLTGKLHRSFEDGGREGVEKVLATEGEELAKSSNEIYYSFLNSQGEHIGGPLPGPPGGDFSESPRLFWTSREFLSFTDENEQTYWPGCLVRFSDGSQCFFALHYEFGEEIRELALPSFALAAAIALAGSLFLSISLSRSLESKIGRINDAVDAYRKGDFGRRVDVPMTNDEFEDLATHLNSLLSNMERLVVGMRRVTSDVAHDLRSPLTRVKTRFEVTLLSERCPEEYVEVLEESLEDVSRLVETFNSLLHLGQLEARNEKVQFDEVEVGALVSEIASLFPSERVEVRAEGPCLIKGNEDLLQRLVSNVVENALKFSPETEPVLLEVFHSGESVAIRVTDRGPGIPSDKYHLVTERFYRGDAARSAPGNGLGLSLVKAVVDRHSGTLEFFDGEPGLILQVTLPK